MQESIFSLKKYLPKFWIFELLSRLFGKIERLIEIWMRIPINIIIDWKLIEHITGKCTNTNILLFHHHLKPWHFMFNSLNYFLSLNRNKRIWILIQIALNYYSTIHFDKLKMPPYCPLCAMKHFQYHCHHFIPNIKLLCVLNIF